MSPLLNIRDEQMKVFEDLLLRDWLVRFLTSSYPKQTAAMGVADLYDFVAGVLQASRARSIDEATAIRKYLHVTFLLGHGFESKPEFAWARKILDDSRFRTDLCRLRVLEDEAIRYLIKSERAGARS